MPLPQLLTWTIQTLPPIHTGFLGFLFFGSTVARSLYLSIWKLKFEAAYSRFFQFPTRNIIMEATRELSEPASSPSENNPTLSSLWETEILNPEDLNLGKLSLPDSPYQCQDESSTVHSPSYDLDHILDFQLESLPQNDRLPDWGSLDELVYQLQNAEDKERPGNENLKDDSDTDTSVGVSRSEVQSGLHYLSVSPDSTIFSSSSFKGPFSVFSSMDEFTPPSSGTTWINSSPAPSMTGSLTSIRSGRGRNRLKASRRPTLGPRDISTFREHVFDSNQIRDSSHAAATIGRQGPLPNDARQMMRAVRAIGACWRCRVLRKPVSDAFDCHSPRHIMLCKVY